MHQHDAKREKLFIHFEECIIKHFDFLNNGSYNIDKDTMGWKATYSSDKVDVSIYYEKISFEIYLTISLKEGLYCTIDEIIINNYKRKYFFGTDENTIENAIIELRMLILQFGKAFLDGEIKAFDNIAKTRESLRKSFNLELVEERATIAWQHGNYDKVIALYKSIPEDLTPIQKKRLSICEKRLQSYKPPE